MSSKATIASTNDDHIYEETNMPHYVGDRFIGFTIVMAMDKKNIRITDNDDHDLVIEIDPGSELYNIIKNLKK